MTLKEKLEVEIMDLSIMDETIDDIGKNLEHVADSFAIGFAQWCMDNHYTLKPYNMYDLVAIYKKETGL